MKATVRAAGPADEEALFELAQSFPTPTPPDLSTFRRAFECKLGDPSSALFVAEADGRVVGYVSGCRHVAFYANGYAAWIDEIFISAHTRQQGVGRALMAAFERWAIERECVLVGLATGGAAGFYEKLGYASKAGYFKKYVR